MKRPTKVRKLQTIAVKNESWPKAVLTNMINVSQETIASSRNFTSVKVKLTVNSQSHN